MSVNLNVTHVPYMECHLLKSEIECFYVIPWGEKSCINFDYSSDGLEYAVRKPYTTEKIEELNFEMIIWYMPKSTVEAIVSYADLSQELKKLRQRVKILDSESNEGEELIEVFAKRTFVNSIFAGELESEVVFFAIKVVVDSEEKYVYINRRKIEAYFIDQISGFTPKYSMKKSVADVFEKMALIDSELLIVCDKLKGISSEIIDSQEGIQLY